MVSNRGIGNNARADAKDKRAHTYAPGKSGKETIFHRLFNRLQARKLGSEEVV